MQIETEKDLRINQLKLIIFVMLAIFIVMLVYTVSWVKDYRDKVSNLVETEAEIVEHKNVNGQDRDVLYYVVDGVEYQITSDLKSTNDVGDIITIFYDADNPMSFMYDDNRIVILPIISACFGVINVALIVVYLVIYSSRKQEKIKIAEEIKKMQEEEQKNQVAKKKKPSANKRNIRSHNKNQKNTKKSI